MIKTTRVLSLSIISSLFLFTLLISHADAKSLYVSPTGNDSVTYANNSVSSPWRTVQHAANQMVAGDTTYIRGGTYNESNIVFANSGVAGSPITFKSYPGEMAVVDGGFTTAGPRTAIFHIDFRNWITLDGITIAGGRGVNVLVGDGDLGQSDHVVITNCVLRNMVTGDNAGFIYANSARHLTVTNNLMHSVYLSGPWQNSAGVHIYKVDDLYIANNEMYNMEKGIYYKHSHPNPGGSLIVENNKIHDVTTDGILWSRRDSIIRNNLIYNAGAVAIRVFEESASCDALYSMNNSISHNTIVDSLLGIYLMTSTDCRYTGAVNTLIENNVIYNTPDAGIGIWRYAGPDESRTTVRYNLINGTVNVTNSNYSVTALPGTVISGNNSSASPIFTNYAGDVFSLTSGSPGKNAASDGTDMGALVCAVGVNASCGGTTPPPPPPPPTDTTAPSLSNGNPTGTLPTGTVSTTLSLSTNENSTCRYSTTPNVAYSNMSNTFTTTGGTSHSRSLTGLVNGTTYNYYVRCMDLANNANGNDYTITFNVANTSTSLQNECSTTQPGRIWCDDFETDRLSSYFEYDNNGGDFARASSVGVDGSTGMRAIWQPGESNAGNLKVSFGRRPGGGFTPFVDSGTSDYRDVYWRMYVKHQPGWIGGGADKLSRATIFATTGWAQAAIGHVWAVNTDYLALDPASGTDTTGNLRTTTYNDFANLRWLGLQQGTTPLFNSANVGQWYCVEAHMKLNDAGQSNGVNELWINDNLQARQTNLNWVGNYNAYGINSIFFENYWNSGSPTTQQRYFDNIVVSTQRIGCGTTTTPPPPPPSDTTPPTVSISSPTGTVSGTVTVSASASDNVGVAGVQFRLNGVNLGSEDTTAPYSVSWNTTSTANGTHTLTAVARDAAGNTSTSQSVSVTVSNTVTPPPPPPVSTRFTVGQRIQTTANVNVRSTASATGLLLGTQPTGSLGTIVSGGTSVDGYYWWNVNYDSGVDGYSVENYLTAYTTTTPPPPPATGWTFCANEYEQCSFSGTKEVRYGVEPTYATGIYTDGVSCSNNVFGDPVIGALKTCSYRDTTVTPPPPPTETAPLSPASLSASPVSTSQVNLTWTDSSTNETGFSIERKTGLSGIYSEVATVSSNTTTYQSTSLTASTQYYFRVRAYNAVGFSSYSPEATAVTANPTPLPPPPLTDTITAGDRVQTTVKAVVRASPGGKRLGTQARYAKGTVTEGPTQYQGYPWYRVNYDSGVDGWTRGDLLTKVSSSTAMSETEIRNSIASIYLLIQQLQERLRAMQN